MHSLKFHADLLSSNTFFLVKQRRVAKIKKISLATFILLIAMVIFNAVSVQATQLLNLPLFAGRRHEVRAGVFTVDIAGGNLICTFNTQDTGWELTETHLYVGTAPPTKAAPGQFPYGHYTLPEGTTIDTIPIPLSEVGCGDRYIAAHAVVRKWMGTYWWEETAWTCGDLIGRGGWGTYNFVYIPCPP